MYGHMFSEEASGSNFKTLDKRAIAIIGANVKKDRAVAKEAEILFHASKNSND